MEKLLSVLVSLDWTQVVLTSTSEAVWSRTACFRGSACLVSGNEVWTRTFQLSTGLLLPAYTAAPRLLGHGIKGQKFSVLRGWKNLWVCRIYQGRDEHGHQTNKQKAKKKKKRCFRLATSHCKTPPSGFGFAFSLIKSILTECFSFI